MLDRALNPDKYKWEELAAEAERAKHKAACDRARERGVALPKQRREKVPPYAVRAFQFSKQEVERIADGRLSNLSRRETQVPKLGRRL